MSAMLERMTLFVFIVERHAPHFFAGFGQRLAEAVVHLVVVGEDAGIDVAQRDHDRAGERGGVDQMSAAELARVEETVGQNQAAFGVGVDDLDRFAGHRNLHVAGLLRFAGRHVFGGADDGRDFSPSA